MGLRTRIKARLGRLRDRFTGDYSAAAEQVSQAADYDAPAQPPSENIEVTRARLKQPEGEGANRA